jgi:hypothetical protein
MIPKDDFVEEGSLLGCFMFLLLLMVVGVIFAYFGISLE